MKTQCNLAFLLLVLAVSQVASRAQVPPFLTISNNSPGLLGVRWNSQSGTNYQLLETTNPLSAFSLWMPVGEALQATNTSAGKLVTNIAPTAFFKMQVQNEFAGLPTCKIVGYTNGQPVSGVIEVYVGAQDDSRLSSVDLYLDDAPFATISDGDLRFSVDTTHFPNGPHTLQARAQDNAGIPYLGGDGNSSIVANETYSLAVSLDFQNVVRWPEAETLFESFVPINVESDIFPADWTVIVEDLTGSGVVTFAGSTTDGIIQTSWDGLDSLGNPAPVENSYRITVLVSDSSSSLRAAQSSSALIQKVNLRITKTNAFGLPDFEVEERLPDLTAAIAANAEIYKKHLEQKDRKNFPPLPPPPPQRRHESRWRKISTVKALFARAATNQISLTATNFFAESSSSGGGNGSVQTVVWREATWQSGKTILARQKYTGATVGATFNATLATRLNQVALLIAIAADDLSKPSREVFNNTVFVVPDHGGYSVLSNDLANAGVRAFYYHGHSDGKAIGFSEFTPTDGFTATQLGGAVQNFYLPVNAQGQPEYYFFKPFSFAFIDGCLSGKGEFPEAFGIPRSVSGISYITSSNRKRRAFMGWGSITKNSIANPDFVNWTFKFWQSWLIGPDYDVQLKDAIDSAYAQYPDLLTQAPLLLYGTGVLRWSD